MKKNTAKTLIIGFGSHVSGKNNSASDFDVGVFSHRALTLSERARLSGRLAKKLNVNEDKIDLVDLRTASPLLLYEVSKKGRLIEGSEFDFIRFKVRAWKIYQDTAKFRRLGEERIKKYVQRIHSQKT